MTRSRVPALRGTLELSAHMTVRPGQLEGFKRQAAECIRLTREKDTATLQYDWFLSTKRATDYDVSVPSCRARWWSPR